MIKNKNETSEEYLILLTLMSIQKIKNKSLFQVCNIHDHMNYLINFHYEYIHMTQ
jgi:hypothetical protein